MKVFISHVHTQDVELYKEIISGLNVVFNSNQLIDLSIPEDKKIETLIKTEEKKVRHIDFFNTRIQTIDTEIDKLKNNIDRIVFEKIDLISAFRT